MIWRISFDKAFFYDFAYFHTMKPWLLICSLLAGLSSMGQNQNISNGNVFDGEPYLAVNPNNPQHMAVAWMGFVPFNQIVIKTKVTEDGGETWSDANWLPHSNPLHGSADPIIDFDNAGNVYAVYIDFSAAIFSGAVYCRKSTDGGYTWGEAVVVIGILDDDNRAPIDRPWVGIDKSGGPNDGNIYVTSMNGTGQVPVAPPYHPYFVRSTDGGESFEPWQHLDGEDWWAGSLIPKPMPTPVVGPDGTFHAVYPSYVSSQNIFPQYVVASSANAGASFNYQTVYTTTETASDSLPKKGYLLRANPSNESHLALFHISKTHGDLDIFLRESFNAGAAWSDPVRVNDDPIGNNRMQDLVWADFDADGDLVVTWRDRRNAPDSTYTTSSEIWGAYRDKDSTHFAPNFILSDTQVAYDTILAESGNDFMCVKLVDDTLNAVWGDTRTGRLNIWFQRMSTDGTIVFTSQISSEETPNIRLFPNPTSGHFYLTRDIQSVEIFDSNGRLVHTANFQNGLQNRVEIAHLSPAAYYVKMQDASGHKSTQTLVVK